ncbi:hypothetical protein G8S49_05690 [Clostridium botulinum C]|uniref:Uncharacterized protein n=2 Tax=Clostridium botulinum TaxID=1491 RepID=A0A9Q4XVA7_CLOBO|nr:hypothetical protein [Clostridium botulinum]YP_398510.1 hypothetical protein CST080 [Clostridium phage c-st]MCD3194875.1 hypothetical protein [Clostridium botulinum C]MCD3200190.1 hypothetical protein [Clostridium botulinum C]MCD3205743.1 hypothetical protein [Clostridium botulinum C]MCD3207422.1 hypothetical protein [Clostridium botulinum C]MCD3226156.1 hypothetical protein [Clostridium botulinum C]
MKIDIMILNNRTSDISRTKELQGILKKKHLIKKETLITEKRNIMSEVENCIPNITSLNINNLADLYDVALTVWNMYEACGRKEGIKFLFNFYMGELIYINKYNSKEELYEILKHKFKFKTT